MKAVLCNQAVRGMLPCTPGRPTLAPRGGLLSSAPRLTSIVRHAQQTGRGGWVRTAREWAPSEASSAQHLTTPLSRCRGGDGGLR